MDKNVSIDNHYELVKVVIEQMCGVPVLGYLIEDKTDCIIGITRQAPPCCAFVGGAS